MKRLAYIIALTLVGGIMGTNAQDHFDALRISQTDITGTARYMSMGGAFGALGGDVSAIKDNPAGLGVFRSSEVSLTLNPQFVGTSGIWNGMNEEYNGFNFNFNQAAFVVNFKGKNQTHGLISSNLSFQYNRLKNFNRRFYTSTEGISNSMTDYMGGYTAGLTEDHLWKNGLYDDYDPWEGDVKNGEYPGWLSVLGAQGQVIGLLNGSTDEWGSILGDGETVNPYYGAQEAGGMDEYGFSWAANISHKFYAGLTVNLRTYNYSLRSSYEEDFAKGGYMALDNELYTNGSGLNFGVGFIARPTNFLRLGVAFQTPTWMVMQESNFATIETYTDKKRNINTPNSVPYSSFDLRSPLKVNASAAIVLGSRGALSFEYNFENYTDMKLGDTERGRDAFEPENGYIAQQLKDVHTFKSGLEFNLTSNIAIRGGYALQTASTDADAYRNLRLDAVRTDTEYTINRATNYISGGIGYRNKKWILDLAYQYKLQDSGFYAFDMGKNEGGALVTSTWHNIAITLGYKF